MLLHRRGGQTQLQSLDIGSDVHGFDVAQLTELVRFAPSRKFDRGSCIRSPVGINLNINLFDCGKITALQQEARLRAFAVSENLTEAENTISNAVRIAWLNARAGYENIAISEHLRDAASQALKLAEARYNLGITSFVELNQAQLSAIDAEIRASRAKYQYLTTRTVLNYQVGTLGASATAK